MRKVCYRTVARRIELRGGQCLGQNSTEHLVILPDTKVPWFLGYLKPRNYEMVGVFGTKPGKPGYSYGYIRERREEQETINEG